MEWYWILGIALVVFYVTALANENQRVAMTIVGALASILFVLIMIYDKL